MDKKERLEALISHFSDGKPSVFARLIGVAPSTISSWITRNTIDYDLLFAKCESINATWLLTGEGDMIINKEEIKPVTPDISNIYISSLTQMIHEKDEIIRSQAEEIGQLKNELDHRGHIVEDAQLDSVANAG